jgi:pimeloyl-ACP methyl ester carboxylesterase
MDRWITILIQTSFGLAERFLPQLSNRMALWFFFRPIRAKRPSREEPVLRKARRARRALRGYYKRSLAHYEAYEWGEGPPILFVHGWGGRGTQFYGMIERFVQEGYRAVAFDAPAHGDSPGTRTNLLEYGEIIRDLGKEYGEFQNVVAHSFGGVASIRALVLDQVSAQKLTIIGAPARMDSIFEGFSRQLRITDRSLQSIKGVLNELSSGDPEEFSLMTHLSKLRQPLLVLHDSDDRSVSVEEGRKIAEGSPQAEWVNTGGLGHNRILSDPTVTDRVLGFTKR